VITVVLKCDRCGKELRSDNKPRDPIPLYLNSEASNFYTSKIEEGTTLKSISVLLCLDCYNTIRDIKVRCKEEIKRFINKGK